MAFENTLLMQPRVADTLIRNIRDGLLPQSLLFSGGRGSGRLTAALDLAFYLTGDRRDILRSSNVIYFPFRNLMPRVKAAVSLFSDMRTEASRLFLIETLRLVNMQYNGALVSAMPSSSSSLFSKAESVDEFLTDIEDRKSITDADVKALEALKVTADEKYLYGGKKSPTAVSIEQLRAVKEWMSSGFDEKVVIIEDIESATEGAKNSILKMLEEPEEHFTIILISSQSQKIMETILSRVRKFSFPSLSEEKISSLLKARFNIWEDYSSFDTFFFRHGNDSESVGACEKSVSEFVSLLLSSSPFTLEREEALNSLLEKLSAYPYFRERVTEEVEKGLREGRTAASKARRILNILRFWYDSVETYNMSERAALDYIIRESQIVK